MKKTINSILLLFLFLVTIVFAQQSNQDIKKYELQSDNIVLEIYEDEPIILKNFDSTETIVDIQSIGNGDEVTVKTDNNEVNVIKGESKIIDSNKDVEVKVISVENDPYTNKEKITVEVKPVIEEAQQVTVPVYTGPFDFTIEYEKMGRGGYHLNFGDASNLGIVYNGATYKAELELKNYNENTKILTFSINSIEYEIASSEFEDKENWKEISIDGLPTLYARGQKLLPSDSNFAFLQLAIKPGFQTGTASECFLSPIYTLKVGESMAYTPAGPTRSSLQITYRSTGSPGGFMNVDLGKGGVGFSSGFSSSRATSFFPVERGEDWLSFIICTVKFEEGNLQRRELRKQSTTDLAIIDMSIDVAGPIKIVMQNTGKTTIQQQQIQINLIINEYNEQKTIDIDELQPGEIQTIVIPDALVGIEFPNVKGTIASTNVPDFVGVVISEEAVLNGGGIESRLDNNLFEVSFNAEKGAHETISSIETEVKLEEGSKRILLTKDEQKIVIPGRDTKDEAWVLDKNEKEKSLVKINGKYIELKQGRSEIKLVEDKYVSITPLYFGDDEVLIELKVKEQNSKWEDPVVYSVTEIKQFKEEVDLLRQYLVSSDSDSSQRNPKNKNNSWIVVVIISVIGIILITYRIFSRKSATLQI